MQIADLKEKIRDEKGHPVGSATDETGMRGFWSHYKNLMETP